MPGNRTFSFWTYLRRSLAWHWRQHVMSAVALAVAIAVLAGALVVGWSLQTSLERELTSRTGGMQYAAIPGGLFDRRLAEALREQGIESGCGMQLPAAGLSDEGHAPGELTLWAVGAAPPPGWPSQQAIERDEVILNAAAARDLKCGVGDWVVIRADISATRPAAGLFYFRNPAELSKTLRLRVRSISEDAFAGFSMAATQARPRNAFVRMDAIFPGDARWANVMLMKGPADPGRLNTIIADSVSLADVGVRSVWADGKTYLHSRAVAFPEAAAELLVKETGGRPVATHIAQQISTADRHVSYGVIAASLAKDSLEEDEVVLNPWVAQDLAAKVGDPILLKALIAHSDGSYAPRELSLRVARIEPLGGGLFVPQVTPELEGMTSAERMDEWKAPFPVDMGLVTPRDDEYWQEHRATPKAIIAANLMRRLWSDSGYSGGMPVTTIVSDGAIDEATQRRLASALARIDSRWAAIDVGQAARRASKGSTDFAGLFAAMSAFVIIASLLVAIGVVRTGMESRAESLGLASAIGIAGRSWRWAMLAEEALVSAPAIAAGVALGVAYGRGLLWMFVESGADTWELPPLVLDARPATLAACGITISLAVLIAARVQMRHLLRRDARELLWGVQEAGAPRQGSSRWAAPTVTIMLISAAAAIILARREMLDATIGFFLAAFCMVVVSWLLLRSWSLPRVRRGPMCLSALALRFMADSPRRVRLTFAMFCAASFVISSVALFRSGEPAVDPSDRNGATGGFVMRLASPLSYRNDLSSEAGREAMGLPRSLPAGLRIYSLLASRGVEGGCLNLASPDEMQVLGVGPEWVQRGGFEVRTEAATDLPWEALQARAEGEPIPVFGDEETMQWIAYRRLGDVFEVPIEGRPLRIRLAGVVRGGLFSGQLLMSEAHLRRVAPSLGYGVSFVEASAAESLSQMEPLMPLLDYGFRIESTQRIIESVQSVQRLYMSMFIVLAALGMLLGAAGSAAVLIRDAAARRGGLALLQAVGLSRQQAAGTLLVGHLLPVLLGLAAGIASAGIAYLAFARPMMLGQPLLIAAAIAMMATLVIMLLARALQPRNIGSSLRTI